MAKYRRKPVVIEAVQWTGSNLAEVLEFTGKHPSWDLWFDSMDQYEDFVKNSGGIFKIKTSEGTREAFIGDWIIKGANGEFYPWKPDIFAATYEAV